MFSLEKALESVQGVAREVGRMQRENLGRQDLLMDRKSTSIDIVTEIDRRSEEFIVGFLRKEYPAHAILAEESGGADGLLQPPLTRAKNCLGRREPFLAHLLKRPLDICPSRVLRQNRAGDDFPRVARLARPPVLFAILGEQLIVERRDSHHRITVSKPSNAARSGAGIFSSSSACVPWSVRARCVR